MALTRVTESYFLALGTNSRLLSWLLPGAVLIPSSEKGSALSPENLKKHTPESKSWHTLPPGKNKQVSYTYAPPVQDGGSVSYKKRLQPSGKPEAARTPDRAYVSTTRYTITTEQAVSRYAVNDTANGKKKRGSSLDISHQIHTCK